MVKDTFFLSHGSPILCKDDSLPAWHFLKSFSEKELGETPSSVLIITPHWVTDVPWVSSPSVHETIHDFHGLPDEYYEIQYRPPGAPKLAQRVIELLKASGIEAKEDKERGIDQGSWVPLMLMYPEADIPICQLSVQPNESAAYHYNLGKALIPLKEEGVLIIGSGGFLHNDEEDYSIKDNCTALPWAEEFDTWFKKALRDGRYEDLFDFKEKAPHARRANPDDDNHVLPLPVAIGAAGKNAKAILIHDSWGFGSYSYASYRFTSSHQS